MPSPMYISQPGELCLSAPGHLQGVTYYIFVLEANQQRLQALCDKYFNDVSGGQLTYRPVSSHVLLTYTHIERLQSDDPAQGWITYNDIAIWVPTLSLTHKAGVPFVQRLPFFAPYIFVDNVHTMVTGREVFGLPKQLGWFSMPAGPDAIDLLTTDVVGTHPNDRQLLRRRLWEVQRCQGPDGSQGGLWHDLKDVTSQLREWLSAMPSFAMPGWGLKDAHKQTYVLGLKQFRDAQTPSRSCYTSIVEAPIHVTHFHGGGRLPGRYDFFLHDLPSHPVAQDLGLQMGRQAVKGAFWLKMDVRMEPGQERWRTTTTPALHSTASSPFSTSVPPHTQEDVPLGPALPKKKIAILGGGIASLTAAYELSEPGAGDDMEISLYQLGWRLGGKGASGRNRDLGDRIEEHGLHVWYGFYENAFQLIQRCYQELGRPADSPMATWQDAFEKYSHVVLNEAVEGTWQPWRLQFPENDMVPGQGPIAADLWHTLTSMGGWISSLFENLVRSGQLDLPGLDRWIQRIEALPQVALVAQLKAALKRAGQLPTWLFLSLAQQYATHFRQDATQAPIAHITVYLQLMDRFRHWLWPQVKHRLDHAGLRMFWIILDTSTTFLKGVVDDDIFHNGFASIDHLDFREWMLKHGAKLDPTVRSGPTVRFIYNAGFSFLDGDESQPSFSAGSALRGALRMLCTYKGAVLWKMRSGMGDVIFAPLYEVLKRRGVRFLFFHAVEHLALDEQKQGIARIDMVQQAHPTTGEYQPLYDVKGLPCWPNEPLYEQLEDGAQLKALLQDAALDLEHCTRPPGEWPHAKPLELHRGVDFDDVILGIPIAALPTICSALLDADPRWQAMLAHVHTVPTQAYQYWMNKDLHGLGWKGPSSIVGTYVDPVDTYCDMTHVLPTEGWPQGETEEVAHIAYLCGVMKRCDDESQAEATARIKQAAKSYYQHHMAYLWPTLGAADPTGTTSQGPWSHLYDPHGSKGDARFDRQYWRANIHGSELYVQSIANTNQYRLRADASGFDGLFLTGDWIDNGFNCGCIEASVMSGMQAARALAGREITIAGESDEWLLQMLQMPSRRPIPPKTPPSQKPPRLRDTLQARARLLQEGIARALRG